MDEELNILDYWKVAFKRKGTIALIVTVASIAAVVISLLIPKTYKAEATLMPIGGQKTGGLASLAAASMGGLGGLLGAMGGTSSTSVQLLAILKSRSLAERVIQKYDLMKVLFPDIWSEKEQRFVVSDPKDMPTLEDAVKALKATVVISDDKKTQMIGLTVVDKDPEFAAKVINDYINEATAFINDNAFTSAKRNRIFIEKQLERNKAELLESGKDLTTFYSANRVSNVVPTVDVDVSQGVDASGAKTDALQKQADELKTKIEQARIVENVPQQVYLQYLTLRRDLLAQVNALLTQQYEMSKIEEAKEDLNFQVIDWARVPIKRYKPKRSQIVLGTFAMSFFVALFYVFFADYLRRLKKSGS